MFSQQLRSSFKTLGRRLGFVLLIYLWHARPLTPLTSEARVMHWGVCQAIWGSASLRDLPQQHSSEAGNFPSWHSQAGEGWGHSNRELCSCTRHQLCTSLQCGEERGWGVLFGFLAVRWGEVRWGTGLKGGFWAGLARQVGAAPVEVADRFGSSTAQQASWDGAGEELAFGVEGFILRCRREIKSTSRGLCVARAQRRACCALQK